MSAAPTIDKMLAEHSSPDGAERNPLAESASFVPGDVSEGDDCFSGGDQCMEHQRRQRDATLSAMAPLKPPPLEVVFQPPNDPGVKDVQVETQVTPTTGVLVTVSVHDDMFNVWHCGSCTYQNLGKAKGACTMYNDPNPIRTGLLLDPWKIGELETHASIPLHQVVPTIPSIFAASPPDDQMPSNECQSRQFCWCKSNESADLTI